MQLTTRARELINQYASALAQGYGIEPGALTSYFSVTPPQETKLRNALLESQAFLKLITVQDVDQLSGQVVAVGAAGLHTGRKKGGRFVKQVGVDGNTYTLAETDSCAQLTWALLCAWANAGSENEFFQKVNDFANECFALDQLRIGFNGTHAAEDTDPSKYPNGEDVNRGWHQIARDYEGGKQIITDAVTLGEGGDYISLDAMASDLINTLVPAEFREDPRLSVMVGADLVAAEQHRLYQAADRPTEKIAAQLLGNSIAARPAYVPPFFPGKRMVVTMLSNLHMYTQRGTRQRKAEHVDDRKAYESKYWRMEGYALEYPELYAAFDESAVTIKSEPTLAPFMSE
ncbi:phage major capsid protein, P2 family [Pragia fontium]|uniref:Phage major capsid protein, P2 family n=1 Tax=Pragia fontium DSM 5563 = ATCC 49100 TaxID=1122977 RepID=A0AAJ4W9H8_9GAMM|nr:phage major capsid protein, P2 family [Pragia fontium]SFC49440.1 phage major capsid protein, P2 family [Pragia fontium DSM 5563 = ATCC 49100]